MSKIYFVGSTKSRLNTEKSSYPTESFAYLQGQLPGYQICVAEGNNRSIRWPSDMPELLLMMFTLAGGKKYWKSKNKR